MKGLNQYEHFDFQMFSAGKIYIAKGTRQWIDDEKVIGTKVDALIWKDSTKYKPDKNGNEINNELESITFKVPKQIKLSSKVEIRPINPVAKVYGDRRNQLSITCDDIEIVQKQQQTK